VAEQEGRRGRKRRGRRRRRRRRMGRRKKRRTARNEDSQIMLTVCAAREIRKVELDLVPSLVKPHGHRANERLYSRC
jgi:hypothetical protein